MPTAHAASTMACEETMMKGIVAGRRGIVVAGIIGLVVVANPARAQLPLGWVTATTGFGVAGAGEGFRTGLIEIGRLAAAIRVRPDVAVQVTATATSLLAASGSTLTDPRPVEPNLDGVAASLAFLSGQGRDGLDATTSIGVGGFKHTGGINTNRTYLGIQLAGDGDVYRLPIAGDLAAGGMITFLPESRGESEFLFGLTLGVRLY